MKESSPAEFTVDKKVDVSADEKLTILAFAIRYGKQWSDALSLDRLAEEICLRPHIVSRSLASLIKSGLIFEKSKIEERGRPPRMFRLDIEEVGKLQDGILLGLKENRAAVALIKQGLISTPRHSRKQSPDRSDGHENLSCPDSNDDSVSTEDRHRVAAIRMVEGRLNHLNSAYILTLAVIVAASDRFGVVKDFSVGDLASLAGVSSLAMKGRLRKLQEWGVVRQIIPGVASSLFRKKLKSIILLNLNHDLLALHSQPLDVVVCQVPRIDENHYRFVYGLWSEAELGRPVNISAVCLRQLRGLPLHGFQQIEFELHSRTAEAFNRLVLQRPKMKLNLLMIRELVRPSLWAFFKAPVGIDLQKSDAFDELIDCFVSLVYLMVLELEDRIAPHIRHERKGLDLMFMPGNLTRGYEYLAILVAGSHEKGLSVIAAGNEGSKLITEFCSESDIPIETRKAAGLIR
jgi:hypothetical protein